jgi:hypothetical protein
VKGPKLGVGSLSFTSSGFLLPMLDQPDQGTMLDRHQHGATWEKTKELMNEIKRFQS